MSSNGKNLKWVGTRPVRPDGVDKVTGRARFGADFSLPNMLVGTVLRSPHAHARIRSIDTSKAEALPGVKAVLTSADLPRLPFGFEPAGEAMVNYRDMSENILAYRKVLYDGHAVAAVAAVSTAVADQAIELIEVDYEVLPHVIDPVEAMEPDAPILHEDLVTEGVEPKPDKPTNVVKRVEIGQGDVEAGFAEADIVIEREFDTKAVHQGYIEPHACVGSVSEDGQAEVWCSTQGQYTVRGYCAKLLGMDISRIRVTPSEIGGGFGGKTVVYLEPLALGLSRKACQPVKMTMSRTEVFRATGPTSGGNVRVKMGVTRDGRITAAQAELVYQAGAFGGSPVQPGCMCAFAPYDCANVDVVGYDVVTNRPKVAAYRAPGAPISEYAVEAVVDELAQAVGMDPIEFRLNNAAREGTKAAYGPRFGPVGLVKTLETAKASKHYATPLGPNQGRGVASGFWFNIGGETCATLNVGEDGTVALIAGTPDIGGSRASLCMMAAEELGIELDKVRPMIADTASLGYTFLTGGSRVTFASGMAVVEAARSLILDLRNAPRRFGTSRSTRWSGKTARLGRRAATRATSSRSTSRPSRGPPERPAGRSARAPRSTPRGRDRRSPPTSWTWRWTARPGSSRLCATPRSRTPGGRCTRATWKARFRAERYRASAGRSTRSTSTTGMASSRTRGSSTIAFPCAPTCR